MIVVNFGHPLTDEQHARIEALADRAIERIIDVPTHFAEEEAFASQVAALVERAGLAPEEWQSLPLLVNLPSYAPIVAVLLAYLHGLSGHFPTVLRLRPESKNAPMTFGVAELVSLQGIREDGRIRR